MGNDTPDELTPEQAVEFALNWVKLSPKQRVMADIKAIGQTGKAKAIFTVDLDKKVPGFFKLYKSKPDLYDLRTTSLFFNDVKFFIENGWSIKVYNGDGSLGDFNDYNLYAYGYTDDDFRRE
jgi:hypothetical protein